MEYPKKFNSKEDFIHWFQNKTKHFAVNTIKFCKKIPFDSASKVITYQLIKSATSVAANYRAACRGRSKSEFYSKICIVVEEADESLFWLELIESAEFKFDETEVAELKKEGLEILSISSKARKTAGGKFNS